MLITVCFSVTRFVGCYRVTQTGMGGQTQLPARKNVRLEDPLKLQTSDKLLVTVLKEEHTDDVGFADMESASLQDISDGDFLDLGRDPTLYLSLSGDSFRTGIPALHLIGSSKPDSPNAMQLIVDTNILASALIRNANTWQILLSP